MRVLVTGATGMIGKELCRVLAADGNELVILSRRPEASTVAYGSQSFRWNPDSELPPKEAWDGGTDEDDAGLSADAKAE